MFYNPPLHHPDRARFCPPDLLPRFLSRFLSCLLPCLMAALIMCFAAIPAQADENDDTNTDETPPRKTVSETYLRGAKLDCVLDRSKSHPDYPKLSKKKATEIITRCTCLVDTAYLEHGGDTIATLFTDTSFLDQIEAVCDEKDRSITLSSP